MARILGTGPAGEYTRAFYYRATQQESRAMEYLRLAIDEHPADHAIREEYLRQWLGPLANDRAPPEVAEVARDLDPRSAAVLSALRHAVRNEWREVALADPQLALIAWTDAWFAEALELRASWRLRVTDASERKRFADEALVLLDRLATVSPTLSIYGLRARAGLAAERPGIVLEALSNYARLGMGLVRAGMNTRQGLQGEAQTLQRILDSVASNPALDALRVAEVRAEIAQLLPK
jgi:hypothetical protein